jgi:hypothetical protein
MAGSTPTDLEHQLIAQFGDLAAAASRAVRRSSRVPISEIFT